jgi:hypothetical protein
VGATGGPVSDGGPENAGAELPPGAAKTAPAQEPGWRQRYEKPFEGGLAVEWNRSHRWFWVRRQAESGSEDFVTDDAVMDAFAVDPGVGEEQIVEVLRIHAEFIRQSRQLDPDIKFKAIEIYPNDPGELGRGAGWVVLEVIESGPSALKAWGVNLGDAPEEGAPGPSRSDGSGS